MKIFATDFDGTLNKNGRLKNKDIKKINDFRRIGHKFGIVTGRPVKSLLHEVRKQNIPYDFIVGINGGIVIDQENREIHSSKLDDKMVDNILEILESEEVLYYGINDGYRTGQVHVLGENYEHEINIEITPVEILRNEGVKGLSARTESEEQAIRISEVINTKYGHTDVVAYPNGWNIDIGLKGNNKARGLEHIAEYFKVSDENIYTVGDSYNDVPMLEKFNGHAMENAPVSIKKSIGKVVYDPLDVLNEIS